MGITAGTDFHCMIESAAALVGYLRLRIFRFDEQRADDLKLVGRLKRVRIVGTGYFRARDNLRALHPEYATLFTRPRDTEFEIQEQPRR